MLPAPGYFTGYPPSEEANSYSEFYLFCGRSTLQPKNPVPTCFSSTLKSLTPTVALLHKELFGEPLLLSISSWKEQ